MTEIDDQQIPDGSEQLDQLESDRSLVDRGLDDNLEEGFTASEGWSPAQGFGNTAEEQRQGETLEMRVKQETPDPNLSDRAKDEPAENLDDKEVGKTRAGRLVDANHGYPGEDTESRMIGEDVGIDGAGASAEEAAMHIITAEDAEAEEQADIDEANA